MPDRDDRRNWFRHQFERQDRRAENTERVARSTNTKLWISGVDFHPGQTASHTITTNEAVLELPNGADTHGYYTLGIPEHWFSGYVQFTVKYTGDTSSTATIDLDIGASERQADDAIDTAHDFTDSASVAGPSADHLTLSHTFDDTLTLGGDGQHLSVRIGRDASDNYAGDAYVTGVWVEFFGIGHV